MCGIFGYIGARTDAPEIVLKGLKKLEYRGYDSWGIAGVANGEITIDKHIGKIGDASVVLPDSSIAIGHTRWATHGGVTVENAHPHFDCSKNIALLHNGIVENHSDIKKNILKKEHIFLSETDTEVIVHLIEELLLEYPFKEAVRQAFLLLRGLNAIVVVKNDENEIIACKNGSPLAVGIGENELLLASDATGIIPYTKKLLFLKDMEMVTLSTDVKLFSLQSGDELEIISEVVDWEVEDADMGTYPHYMIKEIHEQPTVLRNIAKNYDEQIEEFASIISQAYGTFFIAAGTAFYSCLAGTYLFSINAKKHVNAAVASEFNYLEDFLTSKSLIIAVSQSGETIDVIEPLQRAQEKGSKIAGLVNNLGSTLFRMADYKILLGAGPEQAVASTKAYIAQIAVLFLVSYAMDNRLEEGKKLLLSSAEVTEKLLADERIDEIKKLAVTLAKTENIFIIGRGLSYPSALEAALKIKEMTYIHTEGFAGGELKHGTMALISKGTPVIVFAPLDDTYEAILSNAMEVKSRGAMVIGVSPQDSPIFDTWIPVPDIGQASCIAQIIPIQLLSYYIAVEKNLDPDKPRNLAKSVTVK